MTDEEKQIIDDALKMNGFGGVQTYPLITGQLMTNYVPFKKYFINHVYTEEMAQYVKSLFNLSSE